MQRKLKVKAVSILLLFFSCSLVSCTPMRAPVPPGEVPRAAPLTAEDERIGRQVVEQLTAQYRVVTDPELTGRVTGVTARLIVALGDGRSDPWRVLVLEDDSVANAAATRGNNIFIWTGMLNEVRNDEELAVILAHEMAHVLAQHVVPTQAEQANRAVAGLSGAAAQELARRSSIGGVAGLAGAIAQQTVGGLVVNPEQQRIEIEADIIGLHLMADAGYNPRHALEFWERAESRGAQGRLVEFLSTHPTSATRVGAIREQLPSALERYREGR